MARPAATEEEREARRHLLMDAAVQLWLENPDRLASVSEVAKVAGVAKGTVYLSFRSKEDLLLAAHERHAKAFFDALMARADWDEPMTIDDMTDLTRQHIVEVPAFLPLATLINSLLDKGVSQQAANEFEQRMQQQLIHAGARLCRHFPIDDHNDGVRLLIQSYGLILGLWQLLGSASCRRTLTNELNPEAPDYVTELNAALHALWRGTLNIKEPVHA